MSLFSLRICRDFATSARIFTDVQRFSVQIFQEIFFRKSSGKQCKAFLGFFKYFFLTKAQSVKTLHHSKFLSRKAFQLNLFKFYNYIYFPHLREREKKPSRFHASFSPASFRGRETGSSVPLCRTQTLSLFMLSEESTRPLPV